ncbi:MAG: PEP-CTERM sorting domain-containing protein [Planctomycetota bacterium]|nr:PEP-CTERM sorting domain-containing protein [Planctomycetota bacterium]
MSKKTMIMFPCVSTVVTLVSFLMVAVLFSAGHVQAESIVNGDFEAGNSGFSSDYTYFPPPGSENMVEQRYTVCTNPNVVHSKWASMGDHTTGNGMMLIANGAGNSNTVLWRQDVMLIAGTFYSFSAWASGVHPSYPADLTFEIGGQSLGTLQLTDDVPDWRQFTTAFTASTSGAQSLVIRDLETVSIGNDFALDDISLTPVPEPATVALLAIGGSMLLLHRKRK